MPHVHMAQLKEYLFFTINRELLLKYTLRNEVLLLRSAFNVICNNFILNFVSRTIRDSLDSRTRLTSLVVATPAVYYTSYKIQYKMGQ